MLVKPNIAVLLTCHNRKDKTMECLLKLYQQQGLNIDFNIEVFLVDDGSSDGTTDAVKTKLPLVNIIQGNGDLYWNRGMHLAWKTAAATNVFHYYLWLNDDTFLYNEAIRTLLNTTFENSIICGSTRSQQNTTVTYGGYLRKPDRIIKPNGEFQSCDYINGNCVLISKKIFDLVGNLDPIFQHALGDFDYGLRAKKKGVNLFVAPNFVGLCESHTEEPKWMSPFISLSNRIRNLYSASSGCNPHEFFIFDRRHNGLPAACFHYFTIHLRSIFAIIKK
jgi:GT2 family glycosyltransferase